MSLRVRQRGFTYIGVLLLIAMMAAVLAAAGALWATASRRDREAELLFVGHQFRQAIIAFHDNTPAGQQARFPNTLDELLLDKRWQTTRRHLRKVFLDPMTGAPDWVLEPAPGSGIFGVHSPAEGKPMKQSGFDDDDHEFEDAPGYDKWRFSYSTAAPIPASAASAAPKFSLPTFGNAASTVHP